ncbi:MAG: hypothetical protein Q8K82_01690, partial [Gemmatimonadaceae bacterium]|nr:hypothetical protein [Gemmatimonadaceae bacterium]
DDAADDAHVVGEIFGNAIREEMELDTVDVVPSPIFSPGTNCWDVSLTLFYPKRAVQGVRKVYRISVDVADVVPSTVGSTRSWFVR